MKGTAAGAEDDDTAQPGERAGDQGESRLRGRDRNQKRVAMCLAFTAGCVDGYGLLVLGTYVSVMSGDTTMLGLSVGAARFPAVVPPALSIIGFVAGSVSGNLVAHTGSQRAQRILFWLIAALIVVAAPLALHPALKDLAVVVLSLGMGMANPALSRISPETNTVTFMTGALSRVGRHLALGLRGEPVPDSEGAWDTHYRRAFLSAQLWLSFLIGAVISGVVMTISRTLALALAVALMMVLAVCAQRGERCERRAAE